MTVEPGAIPGGVDRLVDSCDRCCEPVALGSNGWPECGLCDGEGVHKLAMGTLLTS